MTADSSWWRSISSAAIRAIARLVPAPARETWRREWTAEFAYAFDRPDTSRRTRWRLIGRLWSAATHALWMRRETLSMNAFAQDLRFAWRLLVRQPSLTIAVVITLAFGIGVNAAVYAVVRAAVLRPLAVADLKHVVIAWQTNPQGGASPGVFSYPDYRDWTAAAHAIDKAELVSHSTATLTGVDDPGQVAVASVTPGYFSLIGSTPWGRSFDHGDDVVGAERVVIVSAAFARRSLAGKDPLGASIILDSIPRRIVGIAAEDALAPVFPPAVEVWAPIMLRPQVVDGRGNRNFTAIAHLANGATVASAEAELSGVMANLATAYPKTNAGRGAHVVSVQDQLSSGVRRDLLLASLVALIVLLVACANVANMLLARNVERAREFAVRAALGAGRRRLVRQVLTESLLLALAGGVVGAVVVIGFWPAILAALPSTLPGHDDIGVDMPVIAGGLALVIVTALISGVPAAWRLNGTLASASNDRHTSGGMWVRRWLVAAQLACAMLLLVVGGLLVRSFERIQLVDPGFAPARIATMQINLPRAYDTPTKAVQFVEGLMSSVEANPGVERAALLGPVPFSGHRNRWDVALESGPLPTPIKTDRYTVTSGAFSVMGVRLLRGRLLEGRDFTQADSAVAVVDEIFASRIFGNVDPIGQRFKLENNSALTIVGVTTHVKHYGLDETPGPQVYVPFAYDPASWLNLVVRTRGNANAAIPDIRRAILKMDPNAPPYAATSVEDLLSRSLGDRRLASQLVGLLALVSLVIAAAGLYGAMAFSVWRRTREMGIRLALGARPSEVTRLVLGEAGRIVFVGAAIGAVGALVSVRAVSAFLFNTAPDDPMTYLTVFVALMVVAMIASFIPARRASRINPITALRAD